MVVADVDVVDESVVDESVVDVDMDDSRATSAVCLSCCDS